MYVTAIPLHLKGASLSPAEARGMAICGHLRVTREPGGRLRDWHRTAMLFRDDEVSDMTHQLHQVQIDAWTPDGVLLVGIEREWRRKACTESPQAWLVSFREASTAAVYPLRLDGVPRPRDEVRASAPLCGQIRIDLAGPRRSSTAKHATLLAASGEPVARLDRVQLQRWDARGLVLAGIESRGHGRRLDEPWQSWFVTFPGPWVERHPGRPVSRPEYAV